MDSAAQDAFRNGPFSHLPFGVGELIRNAEKITKVREFSTDVEQIFLK
jgi:hypothetical protein